MKLAFSTNAFKKVSLEEAIGVIAGIGYAGVEVMADIPHAYPPDMPAERVVRVRELIAAKGMAVSNVNAFTLFAIGDTYHPSWIEEDAGLVAKPRGAHEERDSNDEGTGGADDFIATGRAPGNAVARGGAAAI